MAWPTLLRLLLFALLLQELHGMAAPPPAGGIAGTVADLALMVAHPPLTYILLPAPPALLQL